MLVDHGGAPFKSMSARAPTFVSLVKIVFMFEEDNITYHMCQMYQIS